MAVAVAVAGLVAGCSASSSAPSSAPTTGASTSASPSGTKTPSAATNPTGYTLANLRLMATAEETYFVDYGTYTTGSAQLVREGFKREAGTNADVLYAGADARHYCLVGAPAAGGPWFIYDNEVRGGFVHHAYSTRAVAASYCSDPKIRHYQPIK